MYHILLLYWDSFVDRLINCMLNIYNDQTTEITIKPTKRS